MKPHGLRLLFAVVCALSGGGLTGGGLGAPFDTAFRYQGRLLSGGVAAEGSYDLRFGLFTAVAEGVPCAPLITNRSVAVSGGVFTTALDFGSNVFSGASCWLEIGVRPSGAPDDFVTLTPRQALSPVPYSIYTLKAESLTGPLPDSQLSSNIARLDAHQTFSGTVIFASRVGIGTTNPAAALDVQGAISAAAFSGNGAGLSNVVATGLAANVAQKLWRTPITFVAVTNAGNEPDSLTGGGAVAYPFRIGKFEINNNQYVAFLNAVAASDPHALYSTNMAVSERGGILRSGVPGDYSYAVKPGMGHRPVVWVDYRDAMRFCNWLHHGQPSGAQDATTTEDGAYTITAAGLASNTIERHPQARFWIPSDDEWYKAAYHQPGSTGGDPSDYWLFPTRNSEVPVSEPPPGGINSVNACCDNGFAPTDVGAYLHAPSYYGTFDQAGNVGEWTEAIIYVTNRRIRGGSWLYNEFYGQSTDFEFDTIDYESDDNGIRVAGALDR